MLAPISWHEPYWRGGVGTEKAGGGGPRAKPAGWPPRPPASKPGGPALPIEPHFPADRIARTLSRAGCRLVLTERGSTGMLYQAVESLSGLQTLFIELAYEGGYPEGNLELMWCPASSPTSTSPLAPPGSP